MECPPFGSGPLVTHRLKFLRNSRDRSREIIGLWSPLRRCHIHRMEEMLNAGGWSFKLEEMWLFLDSVQSGNQPHVWLPVFTSQHRTNQERLTKSSVHQQALDFSRLYLPTITNTCYCLPELTRVGTSWYQEYSITTG